MQPDQIRQSHRLRGAPGQELGEESFIHAWQQKALPAFPFQNALPHLDRVPGGPSGPNPDIFLLHQGVPGCRERIKELKGFSKSCNTFP